MRTSQNATPITCPIRRIHRELLRYHLCGYFFAAPRNSCIYVPQRPFRQHWKLLARHQDYSQRPQSLPQHGQAGTGRFGAAWLSCQAAPVSSQWKQHLQSIHTFISKSGWYHNMIPTTLSKQSENVITPPRGNCIHLLNRGWVQYEPTRTAHSIGD